MGKPIAITELKYIAEQYGYTHIRVEAVDCESGEHSTLHYSIDGTPWLEARVIRFLAKLLRRKA